MSHIKTKDIVMGKIKSALGTATSLPVSMPDFEAPILQPFQDEDLTFTFANNFKATKGHFFYCVDEQEFIDELAKFFLSKHIKKAFVWDDKIIQLLHHLHFPVSTTDEDFINCDLGITTCEALIARTGSVMITSHSPSGRRLSVYPPIHVVLAYTSQIVAEIKEGFDAIKQKYGHLSPSLISMITGPSRTADIEKTLVLGAHGPKELILFLIDDTLQ